MQREPSVLLKVASSLYDITARELMTMNEDGQTKENLARLQELGGVEALCSALRSSPTAGISTADLNKRASEFGHNSMPVPEAKTWLELFFASFQDTTLIILIVSAVVSLAVGFYGDPKSGWIEGAAILAAVLISGLMVPKD